MTPERREKIKEQLIKHPDKCPYCLSSKVNEGHKTRLPCGDIHASVSCKNEGCKRKWSETYKLAEVKEL